MFSTNNQLLAQPVHQQENMFLHPIRVLGVVPTETIKTIQCLVLLPRNFDGVHQNYAKLLNNCHLGKTYLISVALTFSYPPEQYFANKITLLTDQPTNID